MSNGHLPVHEDCKMQAAWGEQWAKNKTYDKHVAEGEGEGGHRDRIGKLETQMKYIWWACLTASFVGNLVGKVVPGIGEAVGKILGIH